MMLALIIMINLMWIWVVSDGYQHGGNITIDNNGDNNDNNNDINNDDSEDNDDNDDNDYRDDNKGNYDNDENLYEVIVGLVQIRVAERSVGRAG